MGIPVAHADQQIFAPMRSAALTMAKNGPGAAMECRKNGSTRSVAVALRATGGTSRANA